MRAHRRPIIVVAAGLIACACAAILASVVSAGPAVTKQRIAIVETGNPDPDVNALFFELIPLSPGPLKHDSGAEYATGNQNFGNPFIRDGQQVFPLVGTDKLVGKNGTFMLPARLESVDLNTAYSIQTGTWSFKSGTGAYEGFTGRGRFAGVFMMQKNRVVNRLEGFVTTG